MPGNAIMRRRRHMCVDSIGTGTDASSLLSAQLGPYAAGDGGWSGVDGIGEPQFSRQASLRV